MLSILREEKNYKIILEKDHFPKKQVFFKSTPKEINVTRKKFLFILVSEC